MLNLCTFENRESHLIGSKILALSLEKFCTNFHLTIFLPHDLMDFKIWADQHCKNVTVREGSFEKSGWNIKPEVLLKMLEDANHAVWIDSDIICVRDLNEMLANIDPMNLVLAQDALPYPKENERTAFFSLSTKRKLEKSINSCFIRVTKSEYHINVLRSWSQLMSTQKYKSNQDSPFAERPDYMIGDQDVLEAVLASEIAGSTSELPITYLRSGNELITTIVPEAFSVSQRIRASYLKRPFLIHGQGTQPWVAMHWGRGFLGTPRWQLSAYLATVKRIKLYLDDNIDNWTNNRSILTKFCRFVTLGHPYMQGVPLIIISKFWAKVLYIRSKMK